MRRRLGLFAIAVVFLIAAAAFLVHAPFVRARVLRYAVTTLENQYGIHVEASRLDYNLVSLRVGLADLRVSAVGKQPPFFEAGYVAVAVPRRTLLGDVVFDEVAVTDGVVRIVRQASGEANLPEATSGSEGEREPLRIGRIDVSPLQLDIRDEGSGFALDVPAAVLQLAADTGRIAFTSPATVRVGERGTRVTALEGNARFDGRTLTLADVQVDAEEGHVELDGPITVLASDPSIDLQVSGTGDIARLARWGMAETDAPRGHITFAGRIAGPIAAPAADFDIKSPRIAWQNQTITNVTAAGRVTSDQLTLSQASLAIEGGSVEGSAEVPFADVNALTANAFVRLENRPTPFLPVALPGESRLAVADRSWRLDGEHRIGGVTPATLALRGRIADDLNRSTVAGVVRVPDADVPMLVGVLRRAKLVDVPPEAVPAGRVRGDARLSGTFARTRVEFSASSDNLRVPSPEAQGPVALTGTFDTGTQRYTFDATMNGWMLTPSTDVPATGRVSAAVRGSGRGAAVMADGEVTATDVAWQDVAIGDVTATVAVDPKVARILANIPQFDTTAAGQVAITAPYMASMTAWINDLDLARILGAFETPVPVGGTTSLVLRADGPLENWRAGTADLEVTRFDATAGNLPLRLLSPALLRYQGEHIAIDRFEAAAGETQISASGELAAFGTRTPEPGTGNTAGSGIIATMSGDVGAVTRAVAATGLTELPLSGGKGPVALLARVAGSLETPLVSADVESGPGEITLTDLPTISELRIRTHVEDGWADLRELHGAYQGAMVTATGRAPLSLLGVEVPGAEPGEASLRAKITGITAAVLEPFLDPAAAGEVTGSIDATVSVDTPSLDVSAARGELQLDRLELRVADLPVVQQAPTRIVVRDGLARVEAWDWTGQGANLSVRGQVKLEDLQAAILANGNIDLRMATPFVRAAGLTTAGTLQPRLSITGALTDPRIDGDLTVSGGEMRLVDPRVIISDLNGRAVLTRSTATLTSMTGSINGGTLTAQGGAEFAADGQGTARLGAEIRSMALEFPAGLRSELDGDLQLVAESVPGQDLPDLRIEGTVTMLRGSYREPLAVVTGLLANLQAAGVAGTAVTAEGPTMLDRLGLDVRLVTDEDIVVDNNYGQFQLGADLRVIGTAALPALSGRAELREGGQLFVGRNIYTIMSGTIDFANPAVIEPNMNLELTTRAGGYDIEVMITGTPETLSVNLDAPTAEETLSQADLTALLVTGRTLNQLSTADAALIGAQVLGNFSADLLGFAGRAIGLDTLRIGGVQTTGTLGDATVLTTDLDPTSRLTFGKRLGSDLDVTFSQSLRDGDAQTWIVEYRPSNRFETRLVSNDEDMASLGFRHDVSFGGVRRVERPVVRRTQTRVASVELTGDLITPEPRLRDLLSLTEGDQFDFGEWQRDRDRLLEFYQAQGHVTARMNATRKDAETGVVLAYAVMAGPRTDIVVRGTDLPAPVVAELRQAWADAVFDSFLIDEATQIVRRALAPQGYLQAQVMARLERSAGASAGTGSAETSAAAAATETVTLFIDVMPGARTNTVSIRIQGADATLTEQLSAEVLTRGLENRVATDPGGVEGELTEYLRTRGYLRARVTAGAPLFDGDAAIVPVTVMAGAPITIGAVMFEGVMRVPVEQVRDMAALAVGTPADVGVIDLARQRVVALYRREGFASATTTTKQAVRTGEPLLDVTFVVMEGQRQTLAEIAVSGNRSIDTDVIERALGLTLNEPLRPEEWLQARTRVFDTGLFRRVDVSSEPITMTDAPEGIQPMRMRVVVEEWPILRARYGVQVAQERPEDSVTGRDLVPGLSADITRRTLFGRAITLGAAAGLQRRERLARVFVNAPTMIGLPIQSSLILERARRNFASDTFVTHTSSIAWEQRVRVTPTINFSYAYRFAEDHTFDTQPNDPIPFDVLVHVGRLTGSAAWDTRDDPYDSTRGVFLSSSIELADERLASDIAYLRSLSQAYYFKPFRGLVFASAARAGLVGPLAGQDLLPSFRFFVGGARTIRGVEEDGVGERDFQGFPEGGQGLLVLNQEVRFPIYRWLRGVGFIDTGTVLPETKIAFRDMTTSTGFGLRLTTPFGILRADYGRVLSGENAVRNSWSFGIGQAF
jgi:outer membrane protein assembly factor BamA/autotransporter translocation and assembly factor TamB